MFLKEFISISQGKFHISLNVRTVHVFVYVLLNVEIALAVHTGTSKYGNFCDREVFTNFGKLKLVPKKEEEKKPKNNRLKKKQQQILLCTLNCIVFWEFFHFFFLQK